MAKVTIDKDVLNIDLSLLDSLLAFHGSFHIPFAVQISEGDPNALAHEIMRAIPDSGPVE
jgi:hypothetical protein